MNSITINDLDESLMQRLKKQAAENGRTPEAEAREILSAAIPQPHPPPENLAEAIRAIFAPLGGMELELPQRATIRETPWFGWQEEWDEPHNNS